MQPYLKRYGNYVYFVCCLAVLLVATGQIVTGDPAFYSPTVNIASLNPDFGPIFGGTQVTFTGRVSITRIQHTTGSCTCETTTVTYPVPIESLLVQFDGADPVPATILAKDGNIITSFNCITPPVPSETPGPVPITLIYYYNNEAGQEVSGQTTIAQQFTYTGTEPTARIYWTEEISGKTAIYSARLAGGKKIKLADSSERIGNLALNGQKLYWVSTAAEKSDENSLRIGRANLNGTTPEAGFMALSAKDSNYQSRLAVSGRYLYWSDSQRNKIGRSDHAKNDVNTDFIATVTAPYHLAVTSQYLFWIAAGVDPKTSEIWRANLDGSGLTLLLSLPGSVDDKDIAADDDHVYWTDTLGIFQAHTDGTQQVTLLTQGRPISLDVIGTQLFWCDELVQGTGKIYQGEIRNDMLANVTLLVGDLVSPSKIAVTKPSLPITAKLDTRGVLLQWQHPSADHVVGFHVWRGLEISGQYQRLTSLAIMAHKADKDQHQPAYTYQDQGIVSLSGPLFYKIEIVAADQRHLFCEPVAVNE